MARGQKKPIETRIAEKEELIAALRARLKAEQSELDTLLREKKEKELEGLNQLITTSGLELEEISDMLQEYLQAREGRASA